jgi:hypothetical protein
MSVKRNVMVPDGEDTPLVVLIAGSEPKPFSERRGSGGSGIATSLKFPVLGFGIFCLGIFYLDPLRL